MSLNFYLHDLDVTLDISSATIQSDEAKSSMTTDRCVAHLWVDASSVREVFKFGTNSVDINDVSAEDMYFFVDADGFRDLPTNTLRADEIDAGSGAGTKSEQFKDLIGHSYVQDSAEGSARQYIRDPNNVHYTADNKGLIKDVLRNLAHELFGTQYGVDIFNNETDLCNNMAVRLREKLDTLGSIHTTLKDASGNTSGNDNAGNIGNIIFKHIVSQAPSRLKDISGNPSDLYTNSSATITGQTGDNISIRLYRMPLLANDTLRFEISVVYATNQENVVSRATPIPNRYYEVVLHLE